MSRYDWPPDDTDKAEDWAYENEEDAVAYAAGWTHSGQGYGPEAAVDEWPDVPGFDFDEGLPDWDTGIREDPDYMYRTVLVIGRPPKKTDDGWKLVRAFQVTPEPDLFDEDGDVSGFMYIGEDNFEAVYRLPTDEFWED
jgi:hypothetical protein